MDTIHKDNLTDLVSILTSPSDSSDTKNPVADPTQGHDDYQVVTPDGDTITLNMQTLKKTNQTSDIKTILASEDGQYILVIKKIL